MFANRIEMSNRRMKLSNLLLSMIGGSDMLQWIKVRRWLLNLEICKVLSRKFPASYMVFKSNFLSYILLGQA